MDNVLLISFCWRNQYLHQHSLNLTELRKLDVKCKSILIPDRINLLYRENKTSILYTYVQPNTSLRLQGICLLPVWPSNSNLALGFCWLKLNIILEEILYLVNIYLMKSFLLYYCLQLVKIKSCPTPTI